jgi:hypothetical protein
VRRLDAALPFLQMFQHVASRPDFLDATTRRKPLRPREWHRLARTKRKSARARSVSAPSSQRIAAHDEKSDVSGQMHDAKYSRAKLQRNPPPFNIRETLHLFPRYNS